MLRFLPCFSSKFSNNYCWVTLLLFVLTLPIHPLTQPLFGREKKIYPTEKVSQAALPNLKSDYLTASFWIKQLTYENIDPYQVLKTRQTIKQFSLKTKNKGYIVNPVRKSYVISYRLLEKYLKEDLAVIRRYIKYDSSGVRRRDPKFSNYLANLTDLKKVIQRRKNGSKLKLKYGTVIHAVKLRAFPTEEIFVRRPGDEEFDILIKSFLPLYSGVTILTESADRLWIYVESPFSRGWTKKDNLATIDFEKAKDFNQISPLIKGLLPHQRLVVNRRAVVYKLDAQTETQAQWQTTEESFPMGSILPINTTKTTKPFLTNHPEYQIIDHPNNPHDTTPRHFYAVKKSDLIDHYLPFTRANILTQAFKFLGSDYGWGGGLDQTDCSLFLYYVFRSFGLLLPRSSTQQINQLITTKILSEDQLQKVLNQKNHPKAKSLPANYFNGLTLAYIKGPNHILLYLGKVKNRPFFIHSVWSFKDSNKEYLISSVAVSDLSLGKDHYLGSLAKKIRKLGRFIKFPTTAP